jgi:hypothetical protein
MSITGGIEKYDEAYMITKRDGSHRSQTLNKVTSP